jgi:hypothetical protein
LVGPELPYRVAMAPSPLALDKISNVSGVGRTPVLCIIITTFCRGEDKGGGGGRQGRAACENRGVMTPRPPPC